MGDMPSVPPPKDDDGGPFDFGFGLAGLSVWGGGDRSPGGGADAFLQEDGVFGFLLEDGSSYLLME